MTFGTLLTLFVVPTVYLLIKTWQDKRTAPQAVSAPAE
jgi:antibiotic biosynthesis monooxygenase (ABM) superfamily enzyme